MMLGSPSSMIIGFISFHTFPAAFVFNGVCMSDVLHSLLYFGTQFAPDMFQHNFDNFVVVPSPY